MTGWSDSGAGDTGAADGLVASVLVKAGSRHGLAEKFRGKTGDHRASRWGQQRLERSQDVLDGFARFVGYLLTFRREADPDDTAVFAVARAGDEMALVLEAIEETANAVGFLEDEGAENRGGEGTGAAKEGE